jgi:hypothetical protein
MRKFDDFFEKIKTELNNNESSFKLPIKNSSDKLFLEFLTLKLDAYYNLFESRFNNLINEYIPFKNGNKNVILKKIKHINTTLINTIAKYLEGKPFEANEIFFSGLENNYLSDIHFVNKIESGSLFYRARRNDNTHFNKNDLFHIDFENRHLVSTNRYSIPGSPALYLADCSYVCWEEYDKPKFKNLWLSSFENTKELKVVEILKLKDFLKYLPTTTSNSFIVSSFVQRFFIFFPITIASSIKTKHPNANFKIEYIIPQMLLEYVIRKDDIDGIKFPSTKIDYDKLENLNAYNYIFPVKRNDSKGHCKILKTIFKVSEPSSLELEELLDNPYTTENQMGGGIYMNSDSKKISIIDNDTRYYDNTSFGKIDFILKNKTREKL